MHALTPYAAIPGFQAGEGVNAKQRRWSCLLALLFVCCLSVTAQPVKSEIVFLALSGRVVDQAGILSADVERKLTAQLEQLEKATTDQLVVATLTSLQDQSVEEFANLLFREWRLDPGNPIPRPQLRQSPRRGEPRPCLRTHWVKITYAEIVDRPLYQKEAEAQDDGSTLKMINQLLEEAKNRLRRSLVDPLTTKSRQAGSPCAWFAERDVELKLHV